MWNGWPVERVLFLLLGIVHPAVFVQVTLFHWRQNFRHWAMWLPVLATSILGILSLLLAWQNAAVVRTLFTWISWAGAVIGLIGTYFHLAGVGERVDGYNLSNFMVGPPLMLPLLVTAWSVLGLIAVYLV